jgi:hypothetical protein
MNFIRGLLALSLLLFAAAPESVLGQDKPCEVIRNDLQQKNRLLVEYVAGLKKFDNRTEPEIANLLNSKIVELRQEILKSEKELAACQGQRGPRAMEGLAPTKSEGGEHLTMTCGELKKRLVILVKTVHALRRREGSFLSELTAAEKKELLEASEELKSVKEALTRRCSAPPAPRLFRPQAKPRPWE